MKISINSLNYVSIRGLAEMGLCCLGCCSILWRWCQKKRVKESKTGTVYSSFIPRDSRGKIIKRLLQSVTKKSFRLRTESRRLWSLQSTALCPWHQSGKAFLLYFCSSQTENSLFYSLEPPYNIWKCPTIATTHRLLPTTAPATSSPQSCFTHQPQPHLKVFCRKKTPLHPPCDILSF